jgi:hypothetical protein
MMQIIENHGLYFMDKNLQNLRVKAAEEIVKNNYQFLPATSEYIRALEESFVEKENQQRIEIIKSLNGIWKG